MIKWRLILCAFGKHDYKEPVDDEALDRVVGICKHCSDTVQLSSLSLEYFRVERKIKEIIKHLEDRNLSHAKNLLDKLVEEHGYG